jgi:hypothetical protein
VATSLYLRSVFSLGDTCLNRTYSCNCILIPPRVKSPATGDLLPEKTEDELQAGVSVAAGMDL